MDRRIKPRRFVARASRARRSIAWIALVIAVVGVHVAATRELADRMIELDAASAMPARIAVAYVRTIEPAAPPVVAPRVARSIAKPAPRAPRRAAAAASAVDEAKAVVAEESAPAAEPAAPLESAAAMASPASGSASAPAGPLASADEAAEAGPAGAFEWPASTRVSYVLTGNYRGEVSGTAQVEWIRRADRYQVNLNLVIGPDFAPIISRRMTSEGSIAASGLVPDRYDEDTQVVFRDRRRMTVIFEPAAVVLADGQRRERLAGVQDTASQFVQLTYLFATQPELLRVGNAVAFPLALPRAMDSYVYEVIEAQTLQAPFGPLAAFHLKPRPRPTRRTGELTAELWISPELRYLPVRIRIEQDAATFIDLMIAGKPEMGAPETISSAASSRKTP
jgi:hypothetical protein